MPIERKLADNLEPDVAAKFLSYPIPKAIGEVWEKVGPNKQLRIKNNIIT